MRSTSRLRLFAALALLAIALSSARLSAETMLFRVFLLDGSALVSFGEFARVADRVIVSIPVGETAGTPNLQPVSIPESDVDWEKTDQYADAVRAKRYAETRGENDFAMLSGRVVEALNQVALTEDPARRLGMAVEARRNLLQWPLDNYGYRAADIAQLSTLFDEVISDLRVAAGQSKFEVDLVATTIPPPHMALLPDPSFRDTLEQALVAAARTPEPTERVSLLKAIGGAVRESSSDTTWGASLAARAASALAHEERIEQSYQLLSTSTIAAVNRSADRADIRGLQGIIRRVLENDDRLGHQRPQSTAALLAFLDTRLDDARKLRLARDAWALRVPALLEYKRKVAPTIDSLRRSTPWLDDIRDLAGPAPAFLGRLELRASLGQKALAAVEVPADVQSVHDLLVAAVQMARRAATGRRAAVSSTSMTLAWEASSAAAGALMMLDRASAELDRLTSASPPR